MTDSAVLVIGAMVWMGLGVAHDSDYLRWGACVALAIAVWKRRKGDPA